VKLLLCHGYDPTISDHARLTAWLGRLRAAGFHIDEFYSGMQVRGLRLPFEDLDRLWRHGDAGLMAMYEALAARASSYDALVNLGGVNLHPDFLRSLPTVSVWRFNDDPESSDRFTVPMAPGHDVCAVGNIAELEMYRRLGIHHVYWVPLGFWHDEYDPTRTEDELMRQPRPVDVTMLGERTSTYRRREVDQYSLAFPQGVFRGRGWPEGFLPETEKIPLLQRTKIGFNKHNSTGPINYRTFYLPANGVMQICDNKTHLGGIYELGSEVIGYDDINQAIELTRYYLAHDEEREAIARAGYRRAVRDYNEIACHQRLLDTVTAFRGSEEARLLVGRRPKVRVVSGGAAAGTTQRGLERLITLVRRGPGAVWRRAAFFGASARLRIARRLRGAR
jgi:spore maturation protein CgeB